MGDIRRDAPAYAQYIANRRHKLRRQSSRQSRRCTLLRSPLAQMVSMMFSSSEKTAHCPSVLSPRAQWYVFHPQTRLPSLINSLRRLREGT